MNQKKKVTVQSPKIPLANSKQVKFQNCLLTNADFYETKLKNVDFNKCNLNQANLAGPELADIDLSSCSFESLVVSFDKLAGCIVSSEQAIGFSKALGLIVKE
ncbi:pentapeptide repeat-containing protein [Bacillus sp. V33-4]|uniref:pentapeptide repeat-containing protein n=1 Tax=Bacillus sp. V33-4 TaxID=2054169 RepID=UPI002155E56B|nr:pentapeptide repeat-containing protein [Bacillus sp. V33-4]